MKTFIAVAALVPVLTWAAPGDPVTVCRTLDYTGAVVCEKTTKAEVARREARARQEARREAERQERITKQMLDDMCDPKTLQAQIQKMKERGELQFSSWAANSKPASGWCRNPSQ